ncbi:GNAT family N-acetyltransferase [Aquipuribacter nitratireducens]|uniref:GNAT family N-acetyltransferase n=1 Tax=Aquipuribacter nitratireducens TaxID=650104 RepID=A0ABW0GR07_9MICO
MAQSPTPTDTPVVTASAPWHALDPRVAYEVLRLRVDVFVVEQQCPYPELDGRDIEPRTEHRWVHPEGAPDDVLAYLRVLDDTTGEGPRVARVGRVVTAPRARGRRLADRLVADVVTELGADSDVVLDAQSHLAGWYARHGFVRDGDDFVEDGIPHTPMRRPRG